MHRHSPDGPSTCFGCKVKTLQFATVPGGYRDANSTSYIDHESIQAQGIPTMEEVNDHRTDLYRAAGEAGVPEFDIGNSRGLAKWAEGQGS